MAFNNHNLSHTTLKHRALALQDLDLMCSATDQYYLTTRRDEGLYTQVVDYRYPIGVRSGASLSYCLARFWSNVFCHG